MNKTSTVSLTALLICSVVFGAEVQIENEFLQLQVETENSTFQLYAKVRHSSVVKNGSFASPIESAVTVPTADPVWGRGREIRLIHRNGWTSTLQLFPGRPFAYIHTTVHNSSQENYVSASEEVLSYQVNLGKTPERLKSFGSGFLHDVDKAPGSFSFTAVVDPATRNGVVAASLTHERGSAVFFTDVKMQKAQVKARIDFGRFQVNPGKSRPTETLLLGYFDDACLGLEAYADTVAKQYAIKLKPQVAVYCTWYHARASNEKKLLENTAFTQKQLKPFGLSVMQIDDQWQAKFPLVNDYSKEEKAFKGIGPIKLFSTANHNFPQGMAYTARRIKGMGLVPGIWFMPFAGTWNNPAFGDKQELFAHWPDGSVVTTRWSGSLLDLSNPATQVFVKERVQRIVDWGYDYFKLDGMHTGAVTHNVYVNTGYATSGRWLNTQNYVGKPDVQPGSVDSSTPSSVLYDPDTTHIEAYRKGLQIIRETAPKAFILGCNVSQNMRSMGAAFGLIDAMRIGPDNGGAGTGRWGAVKVGAHHGSNLYFLNRRVWHNDPDPIYVRPSNPLNAARLMASWVGVTGSMLTTSYQFSELPKERLNLLKRCMPGHQAEVRPVDLFESETARIWLVTDKRRDRSRYVIGLFNWQEKEPATITYDMDKLGLDGNTTYEAFDYWADLFVEPIKGTLKQTLDPGTCRILALRPMTDYPQVVSTSRHVTQGVIDLTSEHWSESQRTLSGTSQLVGGDPYEMRITLPQGKAWKVNHLSAPGARIRLGHVTKRSMRVHIESQESRTVKWILKGK